IELYTIQNPKGKIYQVKVSGVGGMKVIDLCSTSAEFNRLTVKDLKEKIMQEFPGKSEDLCMISVDQHMEDDDALLSSYGIQHLSAIMLVLKVLRWREWANS
uniref:Ubiquitin-like domain-containing protein n=1 Tax=Neolamprologus brichardi TaxID=32507 RepID=A0A3Q4G1K1_NEOBR